MPPSTTTPYLGKNGGGLKREKKHLHGGEKTLRLAGEREFLPKTMRRHNPPKKTKPKKSCEGDWGRQEKKGEEIGEMEKQVREKFNRAGSFSMKRSRLEVANLIRGYASAQRREVKPAPFKWISSLSSRTKKKQMTALGESPRELTEDGRGKGGSGWREKATSVAKTGQHHTIGSEGH